MTGYPVHIVMYSIAAYRQRPLKLVEKMLGTAGRNLTVWTSPESAAIATDQELTMRCVRAFGRPDSILALLSVPPKVLLARGLVIADWSPRHLHVWVLVILRRMTCRPTMLWGHAWPRSGIQSRTTSVRLLQARLAGAVLTYTETEADQLRDRIPRVTVRSASNAQTSAAEMECRPNSSRNSVIVIGRLIDEKMPLEAVRSFATFHHQYPETTLSIIGDGPLRAAIEAEIDLLDLRACVVVHGDLRDEGALREEYGRSFCSLSCGTVGLSLIHAHSHGVPMILYTEGHEHGPELEAINPVFDLPLTGEQTMGTTVNALVDAYLGRDDRQAASPKIVEATRSLYSVEAMATAIVDSILTRAARRERQIS